MQYLSSSYRLLPEKPGVYQFLNDTGEILYVGKAKNLRDRVSSYFVNTKDLGEKTRALVLKVDKIKVILVDSEIDALLLEANLIKKHTPKYNIRLTDGKSYPLIRVTAKEIYPKVLVARRIEDPKSVYFGPFPNAGAMKSVLKTIRHIFPYESTPHHDKRPCLYYHLGLCPCVEAFPTEEQKKAYKKTIRYIVQFLDGKRKLVEQQLEKERNRASEQEDFEKAKELQLKIDAITYVTQVKNRPADYELNPNFREDLRHEELKSLKEILKQHGTMTKTLHRIECFDISTIQGYHSTGSMVVFIDGEKDGNHYRRFKVQFHSGKPNDFVMMEEVLTRRFRHTEWPFPNLLIVDGGKGQITQAIKVLSSLNIHIPLIGLAKREETIITSDFQEIHLPRSTKALQMVQRLRDEAHRFAITYHRKLRQKNALPK